MSIFPGMVGPMVKDGEGIWQNGRGSRKSAFEKRPDTGAEQRSACPRDAGEMMIAR